MGRLTGFVCGTLLTLTTTHLLTLRLRAQTTALSQTIKETTLIADSVLLPRAVIHPATARITRPSFTETLKDTWNMEVEGLVRGVQKSGSSASESGKVPSRAVYEKVGGLVNGWFGYGK